MTFTNVDNVISGAGQLGGGSLILINGGTIIADGANALVIDTGDHDVTNSGTIEATGAGGLQILGSVANSGLIWADGGNILIGGDLTGTGELHIGGAATVEIGGSDSNNLILDSAATGLLRLDHATAFTGTISGLNADDGIDLRDVAFGASTTMTYADNGAGGGVLTVSDGVNSVNMSLAGNYDLHNFTLSSDGHGGSLLTNAGPLVDFGSGAVDATQSLSVADGTDVVAGWLSARDHHRPRPARCRRRRRYLGDLGHVNPGADHTRSNILRAALRRPSPSLPSRPPSASTSTAMAWSASSAPTPASPSTMAAARSRRRGSRRRTGSWSAMPTTTAR